MEMDITVFAAACFAPFVLPVCLWVMWSDLSSMKIPNTAVLILAGIFLVVGLVAIPVWPDYPWRLATMLIALVLGIIVNAAGLMGAGDAKFIAAATPFIAPGDAATVVFLLAAMLLAAVATHRIAKYTPLRAMAPHWESWDKGKKFPMGLALGATLALYLVGGVFFGA